MKFDIAFFGYTWEDFFHVISDKEGVLVVYNGCLDSEGTPMMKEILYIDYGKRLGDIHMSENFQILKSEMGMNELLFFSFAPTNEIDGRVIKEILVCHLKPRYNNKVAVPGHVELHCKGACALFPKHLLSD